MFGLNTIKAMNQRAAVVMKKQAPASKQTPAEKKAIESVKRRFMSQVPGFEVV